MLGIELAVSLETGCNEDGIANMFDLACLKEIFDSKWTYCAGITTADPGAWRLIIFSKKMQLERP